MRTLKSMDVSPVLAMVAVDYLISECNNPRPDETTVINLIEEGITSFGSASSLMDAWLDHFGVGYVPGQRFRALAEAEQAKKLQREAKIIAAHEEMHRERELENAWDREVFEQHLLERQREAMDERSPAERAEALHEAGRTVVTVDFWQKRSGHTMTRELRLFRVAGDIKRCNIHRSVTIWF